jgi:teichuronic acid biosynthesis glycosyltransferase TuaH
VVFVSHTADAGTFKVGSHHLAREMGLLGHNVLHISTPWSWLHSLLGRDGDQEHMARVELARNGPRRDEFGVLHSVPISRLPSQLSGPVSAARTIKSLGFADSDYLFVDQPLMAGPSLRMGSGVLIYRPTDTYTSRIAVHRQAVITQLADGVACTSRVVEENLPINVGQPRMIIENGVEHSHFSNALHKQDHRHGVIYIGALDHRFSWETLLTLARSVPTERFTIVGPSRNVELRLPPNVRLTGSVNYKDIPTLLASHKVGILPLSLSEENAGRSPMKLHEYVAAGLYALVSKQSGKNSDPAVGILRYATDTEAVTMLKTLLAESTVNLRGSTAARAEDWSKKAETLLEFASTVAPAVKQR